MRVVACWAAGTRARTSMKPSVLPVTSIVPSGENTATCSAARRQGVARTHSVRLGATTTALAHVPPTLPPPGLRHAPLGVSWRQTRPWLRARWGTSPPRRVLRRLCRGTGQTPCRAAAAPGSAACGWRRRTGQQGCGSFGGGLRVSGERGGRCRQCSGRSDDLCAAHSPLDCLAHDGHQA